MTQLHQAYQNYNVLPPLNPDEKANPFSKFYYVPVKLPAPEILAAIEPGKPMDPGQHHRPRRLPNDGSHGAQGLKNLFRRLLP